MCIALDNLFFLFWIEKRILQPPIVTFSVVLPRVFFAHFYCDSFDTPSIGLCSHLWFQPLAHSSENNLKTAGDYVLHVSLWAKRDRPWKRPGYRRRRHIFDKTALCLMKEAFQVCGKHSAIGQTCQADLGRGDVWVFCALGTKTNGSLAIVVFSAQHRGNRSVR